MSLGDVDSLTVQELRVPCDTLPGTVEQFKSYQYKIAAFYWLFDTATMVLQLGPHTIRKFRQRAIFRIQLPPLRPFPRDRRKVSARDWVKILMTRTLQGYVEFADSNWLYTTGQNKLLNMNKPPFKLRQCFPTFRSFIRDGWRVIFKWQLYDRQWFFCCHRENGEGWKCQTHLFSDLPDSSVWKLQDMAIFDNSHISARDNEEVKENVRLVREKNFDFFWIIDLILLGNFS